MQTFDDVVAFLFSQLPVFQRDGAAAYKKDLHNTVRLLNYLGNPHLQFRSIHVAGTNGKGSTSHALAAIMQQNGYKTGLYTSPHLKSFTERIKINGLEIEQQFVVDFVQTHQDFIQEVQPSFFEITVAMAFDYFAKQKVDIAIIETGMGGRLDSTNIIQPLLSIITNIGKDHTQFLGETLPLIAGEKAGIIKENTPVIIGEKNEETTPVFIEKAKQVNAPIYFAEDMYSLKTYESAQNGLSIQYQTAQNSTTILCDLRGIYQTKNMATVLTAVKVLVEKNILLIQQDKALTALSSIVSETGLKGRWQILQEKPWMVCDTGHNTHGIRYIVEQIQQYDFEELHLVLGFVNDKSIDEVLQLFPQNAHYYFTQAQIPRALPVDELVKIAAKNNRIGPSFTTVEEAIQQAKKAAHPNDFIFIGGSTFIVAEADI